MANLHVLIDPEHFGSDEEGDMMLGEVCAVFFDKAGEQWIAFEIAEMDGVMTIYEGSKFLRGMGTEEALAKLEKEMRVKPIQGRIGEERPA